MLVLSDKKGKNFNTFKGNKARGTVLNATSHVINTMKPYKL